MARSRGDERAWIRGAQSGSVPDLEALFRHHWPRAYRAAYLVVHDSAAAEDIAQEAFLAAVRGLDRFDRRRPFGPWLHRIVVNRAIDWSRSRALRRESGDAWLGLGTAHTRLATDCGCRIRGGSPRRCALTARERGAGITARRGARRGPPRLAPYTREHPRQR